MTKKEATRAIALIEKHMKRVAKTRDDLDNAIMELEGLRDNCSSAWDSLTDARDALSHFV